MKPVESLKTRWLRDWIHYKREAEWAEALDDRARVALLREMFLTYLSFQEAKTAEQLEAEARAERALNARRLNPKYQSLLLHADDSLGTKDTQKVIVWLEHLFSRHGVDRSYGGAIARNFYAAPRFTKDIDILV
jgi:hypothetical protein